MGTSKGAVISIETLSAAKDALVQLAAEPVPTRLSKSEAIAKLAPEIQKLLRLGHTVDEVTKRLNGVGIAVASSAVARCGRAARKQTRRARKDAAVRGDTAPAK